MLSRKLADLSEMVLREPRIKRGLRADLAAILADHAEAAAGMERSGLAHAPGRNIRAVHCNTGRPLWARPQ